MSILKRLFNRSTRDAGPSQRLASGSQIAIARRVYLIGGVVAFSTVLFYLTLYWQSGVWQILFNAIGVSIALLSIGAGYLAMIRGRDSLSAFFGLMAVIIAYAPGEFFWENATIYNLVAGLVLLSLVGLVLRPRMLVWGVLTAFYITLLLTADVLEPYPRYDINQNTMLRIYIPLVAVTLSGLISWQLFRVFRVGNIRTRLVIAFLTVTIIPLIMLTVINNAILQGTLVTNANQALAGISSEAANSLDSYLRSNLTTMVSEGQIPAIVDFLSLSPTLQINTAQPERNPAIESLNAFTRKDQINIQSYALINENGINVLDTISFDIGEDVTNTEYFQASFVEGDQFVSSVRFPQLSGVFPYIIFSHPVSDERGTILGVLRMRINASVLQDIIKESNDRAGEESFGVVFDNIEGNYIHLAHGTAPETIYTTLLPFGEEQTTFFQNEQRLPFQTASGVLALDLPELADDLDQAADTPFFTSTDVATGDRINQVAVKSLVNKPEWVVAFFQPQDVFLVFAQQQTLTSTVLVIFFSAIVAGAALLVSQILANPIRHLSEIAQTVAAGDLSVRAHIESDDELGALAQNFNSMTEQLEDVISNLEVTISERTIALERRAAYLQAAAEVGRTASEQEDIDEMLESITQLISERFGFYHVGILLIDERGEYAVLRATNSEGGWRMMARGHKLRVGEQGIVGYVTSTGKARIEQSVAGEQTVHFSNPELPHTRSELALPLLSGSDVLGALDVQSTEEEAFTGEDITILQVLADQVALAINNTLLLKRVQESIEAERRAYGEISGQAWTERIRLRSIPGYVSHPHGFSDAGSEMSSGATTAIETATTQISATGAGNNGQHQLALPIKIHGNMVLGVLETYKPAEEGAWTDEEIEMLETIGDQIGTTLENSRLFEETQRIADRERITSSMTSQVWSSTDMEKILQTAAEELGRALNASQSRIRLKNQPNEPETK